MSAYHRFSGFEREEFSRGLAQRQSVRTIAQRLGRAPSTLSREYRRAGGGPGLGYRAWLAHPEAVARGRRKPRKLATQPRLRAYVLAKLRQEWSPRQIAKRLVVEYPDDATMRVCPETIYQYLYVLPRGALKVELLRALRHKPRYRRTRQLQQETARLRRIPDLVSIEERPAAVADRSVPGHWEGDLLMGGTRSRSALGTLVERQTRLVLLVPLARTDMRSVQAAFARAIRRLPTQLAKSLTYDQGREMRDHRAFTLATRMTVYFAHPHSPWERGTCENTNGLLRQYFPKGTDFTRVSRAQIRRAETRLNTRPRAVLQWRTPREALQGVLETRCVRT